jgi:hypothetical protein
MKHPSLCLIVIGIATLQLIACDDQGQVASVEKKTSAQRTPAVPSDLHYQQSGQGRPLEHKIAPVPKIISLSSEHESVYIGKPLDANDRIPVEITDKKFEPINIGEPLDADNLVPAQQLSKLEQEKIEIGDFLDANDLNPVQTDNKQQNKIMIGEKLDANAPYTQVPDSRIKP